MDAKTRYYEKPWVRFYPAGAPETIEIPNKSLPQVFDEVATKYSGRDAIIFYGNRIGYAKLKEEVDRFATALQGLGIGKGDKIALYLLNSPQFIVAYFGALKAGAAVSPISPVYTSIEVRHQLLDSGARSIVCQDFLYDNVERAELELKNIIVADIGEYLPMSKKIVGKSILGRYGKSEAMSPISATMMFFSSNSARSTLS